MVRKATDVEWYLDFKNLEKMLFEEEKNSVKIKELCKKGKKLAKLDSSHDQYKKTDLAS